MFATVRHCLQLLSNVFSSIHKHSQVLTSSYKYFQIFFIRPKRTLFLFPSKDDIYCSPSRSWNFGLKICVRSTVVSGVVFCYILKDIYARFKSWVFFLLNETRYSLRNKMRNDYHDESNIMDGF